MAGKLSKRDMLFADEYLIDLDCKNAAIRAGFSVATAKDASEWIRDVNPTKPRLKEEIDRRIAERSRRTGITADRVLMELARVAFANIGDIVDLTTGEVSMDAERPDMAAIASVKIKQTANSIQTEIHMADRNRALELLGKHLGMFEKDASADGKGELTKLDKLLEGITHAAQS